MNDLFVLSNSPGEVAGWLGPVARALAASGGGISATVVTLPCPYASGMEGRCAQELPGVRRSMSFREAFSGCGRAAQKESRLILQLGGDPMYGFALSARMKAPWMIYTARPKFKGRVAHYFIPDQTARARFDKARVPEARRSVVGNLILDSVPERGALDAGHLRARWGLQAEDIITFMPGSRPFEYELGCGFFCECARLLRRRFPQWQAVMPVAPTVDDAVLCRGLAANGLSWTGGERPEAVVIDENYSVPLVRSGQYEAIAASSLAVALPGTNNLQIAALSVPLLMVAPLNEAQNIPLDGLAGIFPHRSRVMGGVKKRLVMMVNAREKYVSLPNRIAGAFLLPERRELMTPESACAYIAPLMESPEKRRAITEAYGALNLERGAAGRIAEKVAAYFAKEAR